MPSGPWRVTAPTLSLASPPRGRWCSRSASLPRRAGAARARQAKHRKLQSAHVHALTHAGPHRRRWRWAEQQTQTGSAGHSEHQTHNCAQTEGGAERARSGSKERPGDEDSDFRGAGAGAGVRGAKWEVGEGGEGGRSLVHSSNPRHGGAMPARFCGPADHEALPGWPGLGSAVVHVVPVCSGRRALSSSAERCRWNHPGCVRRQHTPC